MTEKTLNYEDVTRAIKLYKSLPAAILFRGLTGYGLVIDNNDQEVVGKVDGAKAIWKPMYFTIVGGSKHGREKITAEHIKSAMEEFQLNPLWALLKSTTGYGLKADTTGMVELAEAKEADSQITFEVSHYGGRSIVTELNVDLGKLVADNIEWKSGFGYCNSYHRSVQTGSSVVLSRFLESLDERVETLDQILRSIQGEAYRIGLMNTDGNLPKSCANNFGKMTVFLKQELTRLLPGVQVDEQSGFQYSVRQDGVVEIQRSLSVRNTSNKNNFETIFEAFRKECSRVLMMYCESLTDSQRQKSGRPTDETFGFPDVQLLDWQKGRKGGVIAFHPTAPRRQDATFPAEGWNPEAGKRCRCLCFRKGRGFVAYPAPIAYVERFTNKDENTAVKQVVKIAFDGQEKIVSDNDIPLKHWREYQEGQNFLPRLEMIDGEWWIIETITGYQKEFSEVVEESGEDINGQLATKIVPKLVESTPCQAERRSRPEKVWITPKDDYGKTENLAAIDTDVCRWKIVASGKNPDGKEIKESMVIGEGKWDELPENLRQKHLSDFPVCDCQRRRYEKFKADECFLCQNCRNCEHCGKEAYFGEQKIIEIQSMGGKFHCNDCSKLFKVLSKVDQFLTQEKRQKLSQEADWLLQGRMVDENVPDRALQNIPSHFSGKIGEDFFIISVEDEGYFATTLSQKHLEMVVDVPVLKLEKLIEALTPAVCATGCTCSRIDDLIGRASAITIVSDEAKKLAARIMEGNLALAVKVAESDKVQTDAEDAVSEAEKMLTELGDFREDDNLVVLMKKAKKLFEKNEFIEASQKAEEVKTNCEKLTAMIQGGALLHFGGHFRRMGATGQADFWVISSDGSLREVDNIQYRKRYMSEGDKYWRMVKRDELALEYSKSCTADHHHCEVVKFPIDGITKAQLRTVANIESEIGAPLGSFGLDPEIDRRVKQFLAEYAKKISGCPGKCSGCSGYNPLNDLDDPKKFYMTLLGPLGWGYCQDQWKVSQLVNWNEPFDQEIDGRGAQVVKSYKFTAGMVEFLAYEKYGTTNLTVRFRDFREGEDVEEIVKKKTINLSSPSADSVAALLKKFKK